MVFLCCVTELYLQEKMKIVLFTFLTISSVNCITINDTKTLLSDLLRNYDTGVRPVENQDDGVNVSVNLFLKSIQEFDEVKGMFAFVGGLHTEWNDCSIRWSPDRYGGLEEITIPYKRVWVPNLALTSASEEMESLGQNWNVVRYFDDGDAYKLAADVFKSTCSVNVKNYPFDIQECVTSFNVLGYSSRELFLTPLEKKVDMSIYMNNPFWDIVGSSAGTSDLGGGLQIDFTFRIQRKSSYIVLNVILPILFLCLINVLVFLLPAESGERTGFSTTVLLSIAVFMIIVSDTLPKTSEPVPVISYKLTIDMVTSSLIVLVTILNLRLYNRNDQEEVPHWLIRIYALCCIDRHGRNSRRVNNRINVIMSDIPSNVTIEPGTQSDGKETSIDQDNPMPESQLPSENCLMRTNKVTWRMISYLVDCIALIVFLFVFVANSVVFMIVSSILV